MESCFNSVLSREFPLTANSSNFSDFTRSNDKFFTQNHKKWGKCHWRNSRFTKLAKSKITWIMLATNHLNIIYLFSGNHLGRLRKNRRQKSVHGRCSNYVGRLGFVQYCDWLVQVIWNVLIGQCASQWTKNEAWWVKKQPRVTENRELWMSEV